MTAATLRTRLLRPHIAPFLWRRANSILVLGFAAAHIALSMADISAWQCPLQSTTGVPCPGCGLTRAVAELFHGHLAESLQAHLFGVLVLPLLALCAAAAVLTGDARRALLGAIENFERRTAAAPVLMVVLLLHWILKLAVAAGVHLRF